MTNCRTFPNLARDGPTSGRGAARRRCQEGFISMSSPMSSTGGSATQKPAPSSVVLLTPKEAALRLRVSDSFLAKKRMTGDGPPFLRIGRSIRYSEATLMQWMRGQQRSSTSEP